MFFGLLVLLESKRKQSLLNQANDLPITILDTYMKAYFLEYIYQSHIYFEIIHNLLDILNAPSNPKPNPKFKYKQKTKFHNILYILA